jgi:hypothetical protein
MADDDADFIRHMRLHLDMLNRFPRITPGMREAFDALSRTTDPEQRRQLLEWQKQQPWAYPGPPAKPSPVLPQSVAKDPSPDVKTVAEGDPKLDVTENSEPAAKHRKKGEPREVAKAALLAIYKPDGCPPKDTTRDALHAAVCQHIRAAHPGELDEEPELPSDSTVNRAREDLEGEATARVLAEKQAQSKKAR